MRRFPAPLPLSLALMLSAIVVATPVVAQDDAYQAALESGDLASLVPPSFADAEELTVPSSDQLGTPPSMDTDDGAAARAAFMALLDDAGITPADSQEYAALKVDGGRTLSFGATRYPGIAAADWFELLFRIATFRNFSDPARELVEIGPKQVLRIGDRGSDRSRLYYPQGEILWSVTGDEALATAFFEELATIDGPALSVDPGGLVDGEPVATIGTADDALSQIPAEIRGVATTTQTIPAATLIDSVSREDEEGYASAQAFAALLESLGGVDRATFVSSQAIGDDGGIAIAGVTVEGADHTQFSDALLETLVFPNLESPEAEEETLGGKTVVRITDGDSLAANATYIYGVGETVWLLNGQEEWIAALLRTMP